MEERTQILQTSRTNNYRKQHNGSLPVNISTTNVERFFLALAFFTVGFLFDDIMTGVAMWRARELLMNPQDHPPQPDVGFDLIPKEPLCRSDYMPTIYLVIMMLCTFFRLIVFNGKEGLKVIIRFALVDGVLMFLRGCVISITSLDNPWPDCNYCGGSCPDTALQCVLETLRYFPFWDCGDLIFSGHTVHFLLCALSWQFSYKGRNKKAVMTAVWLLTALGLVTLIACRFHYSVDIVVALFLTLYGWYTYESLPYLPPNPVSDWVIWFNGGSSRSM